MSAMTLLKPHDNWQKIVNSDGIISDWDIIADNTLSKSHQDIWNKPVYTREELGLSPEEEIKANTEILESE